MKKNGISLIVLIISIIVVIILAAVVILTLSKNNPIESAKEARFKEDVRTFQDELALYISKQYANSGGHWDGNISAKSYNQIVEYIPSFTKKYDGKFVINNNNLEYTNKLDEKEKEYAQSLNVNKRKSILPDEYQQVEYIESTGSQYISTGFCANQNTSFLCDCIITDSLKSGYYQSLFGATEYKNNKEINRNVLHLHQPPKGVMACYGNDLNVNVAFKDFDTRHIYELKKEQFFVDGEKMVSLKKSIFQSSADIYIFKDNNPTSITKRNCMMELFNFEIYDDEILIRKYIPCYSIKKVIDTKGKEYSAGTKGLYDIVEGKFYTNQGDPTKGDFIAGPDVNE